MKNKFLSFIFCLFALIVGVAGGVFGVILGTILIEPVLGFVIEVIKEANLNSFSVNDINMTGFTFGHSLLLIFGSMVLTVLSGIIPAILASKKDPVKALLHQ